MSLQEDLGQFEAELTDVVDRAAECVGWLRSVRSEDLRFLVAERLPMLGRLALPALMSLVEDAQVRGSTRYLSAWVAVEVGDRGSAVDVLCDEVAADSSWSLPAAGVLARHGIREATGPVLEALGRVDPQDDVSVMGYATALRDLGGSLPSEIRRRLFDSASPWVVGALMEDFPA